MPKTLFIVNPNAGRTRNIWRKLKPHLNEWVSDYTVVMTRYPEDVVVTLNQSRMDGVERIITVGGDGTNNLLVNALMEYRQKQPEHHLSFGSIPAGTGRDFARGVGFPLESMKAAQYLLQEATPTTIDMGLARFAGQQRYFLNVANAGIADDVVQRVERSGKRPWSFPVSVVRSLIGYKPEAVQIELDGEHWFEGKIYIMAVANGTSIGQGILIAPDAKVDDGKFDVVIAEEMPFFDLIQAFPTIYYGTHITHPKVKIARASHVKITSPIGEVIGMDMDGEAAQGDTEMTFELLPSALEMLL